MNTSTSADAPAKPRGWLRRAMRLLDLMTYRCLWLLLTLWAAAALYFDVRVSWLRTPLAGAYLLAVLAVWILVKGRWLRMGLTFGSFTLVLGWRLGLQPANDRDWQPDVSVLAYADIAGNKVTVASASWRRGSCLCS